MLYHCFTHVCHLKSWMVKLSIQEQVNLIHQKCIQQTNHWQCFAEWKQFLHGINKKLL